MLVIGVTLALHDHDATRGGSLNSPLNDQFLLTLGRILHKVAHIVTHLRDTWRPRPLGCISRWGKLPFDRLRANGQAFSFALSRELAERSKGEFAPNLKYAPRGRFK